MAGSASAALWPRAAASSRVAPPGNSSNAAKAAAIADSRGFRWGGRDGRDRFAHLAQTFDVGQQLSIALDACALVRGGLAVEVGARQLDGVVFVVVSHHRSIRAGE